MKRPSPKTALWFCLPFVILVGVVSRSRDSLQLPKDNGFFAEEVKRRISVGMPLGQAEEILSNSGFGKGYAAQTIARGRPTRRPLAAEAVKFTRTQSGFPLFLNKHEWEVDLWPRNGRVLHGQGAYYYRRWD